MRTVRVGVLAGAVGVIAIAIAIAIAGCGRKGSANANANGDGDANANANANAGAGGSDAAFVSAAAALEIGSDAAAPAEAPRFGDGGEARPGFRKTSIEPAQLAKIFAQVPELARIGSELRYFTAGDVSQMYARSGASHEGITFTTSPILWSPESSTELLVATGRGKNMSFVVALWTLPDEKYGFASSFLMLNDLSPVALAYDHTHRKELRWTSCWGCNGEQGFVSYRAEERRVVIVQQ